MRIMIPTIGAVLELTEDWTFTLHEEKRNHDFATKALGLEGWRRYAYHGPPPCEQVVTLPAGSRLKVDRIYIRSGGADMKKFDSVTFRLNGNVKTKRGDPKPLKGRFWAKLKDVNRMRATLDPTSWPGLTDMEMLAMVDQYAAEVTP